MTTDPGDIVLDPFCGGGSGAVATKQMGRNYIGAEIDPYYQQITQQKLDETYPTFAGQAYASIHLGNVVSIRDCDIREKSYCSRQLS